MVTARSNRLYDAVLAAQPGRADALDQIEAEAIAERTTTTPRLAMRACWRSTAPLSKENDGTKVM
jgi:hypothetical protein